MYYKMLESHSSNDEASVTDELLAILTIQLQLQQELNIEN